VRAFLFRLALAVGEWDVDAIGSRIPMSLLVEWMAYWHVEPFGDDWRRSGRLATIVAAASGAKVEGELEEKFLPGGGIYRGMNQTEQQMLDEIRKIPGYERHRGGQ
jgi:hypothetical protein